MANGNYPVGNPNDPDDPVIFIAAYVRDLARLEAELAFQLKRRFQAIGLASVELVYHLENWELKASRGTNNGCQTSVQVKEVVERVAKELDHEIADGLIVALALGDQLGAAFRLRRTV